MKWVYIVLSLLVSCTAWSQDERFYHLITQPEKERSEVRPKLAVSTPDYLIDLNRDGINEILTFEKRDAVDVMLIKTAQGVILFEGRFLAKGYDARPLRARLVTISENIDVLLVSYYEGTSGVLDLKSTARLYIATFENRQFDKVFWEEGPSYFLEKDNLHKSYILRPKHVRVTDLNNDKIKEIIVQDQRSNMVLALNYSNLREGARDARVWEIIK